MQVISEIKTKLKKDGFVLVHAKQGNDNTTILSYGKDGYEVTILIPGEDFKPSWAGMES